MPLIASEILLFSVLGWVITIYYKKALVSRMNYGPYGLREVDRNTRKVGVCDLLIFNGYPAVITSTICYFILR